jgi:uncharacterized protein with HEPN domain
VTDGRDLDRESADEATVVRRYDERTYTALSEILRICEIGERLVARGSVWYWSDPENLPGLAAESLIVKIGENVSRVSDACKKDHPQVPWRDIEEMRNRLTHYYEGTDYQIVWDTLVSDFPAVRDLLLALVHPRTGGG